MVYTARDLELLAFSPVHVARKRAGNLAYLRWCSNSIYYFNRLVYILMLQFMKHRIGLRCLGRVQRFWHTKCVRESDVAQLRSKTCWLIRTFRSP